MASKMITGKLLVFIATTIMGFNHLPEIQSTMLGGLVAPIEVIEEWGCYDTEIRLTCGNLESKLAILEAKFTPRCRAERAEECVYVDENSITHSFSSRKIDKLTLEEKEAGQRFLQTLRRNHEHKRSREEASPSLGAVVHAAGSAETANVRTVKDKRSSLRSKLEHLIVRYLRRITDGGGGGDEETDESGGYESSSSRYRRQVSIDGNGSVIASVGGDNLTDVPGNEVLGSSVEITLLTNNDTDSGNGSAVGDSSVFSALPIIEESVVESVNVLSSTVVANVEDEMSKLTDKNDDSIISSNDRSHHAKTHDCSSIRKRIAQLDKFEIQKSMRNDSFHEYNIRNALNYRCSGKNHCSFVFSQDHPYAVVWREGIIRVKYICMDEFRISKYCDEHLIIGNEDQWERRRGNTHRSNSERAAVSGTETLAVNGDSTANGGSLQEEYGAGNGNDRPVGFTEDRESQWSYGDNGDYDSDDDDDNENSEYGADYGDGPRGEPRAEALQQGQQQIQQMHPFHNLKILKTLPGEEAPLNETEKQRKLDADTANRQRQRQKVFSQDFRVLKILPSDLDEVEDIKQVGNEYYFKKDIEVVDDSENEIIPTSTRNDSVQFSETLDIVVLPQPAKDVDVYESNLDPSITIADSIGKTTVNIIELISPTMGTGSVSSTSQKQTYLDVSVHSTVMAVTSAVTENRASLGTASGPSTPLTTFVMAGGVGGEKSTVIYPDAESNEIEGNVRDVNKSEDEHGFSFNNRTFKKIQESVLKEISASEQEGSDGYPVNYGYDDDDDFEEEENDDDDDYEEVERRGHKKYISIQRTLLRHPLRQGFLMTPGYPKYYIGDSVCRWTLYTRQQQKIKLTILDLALRSDEPCRDYVEIRDLNMNRTLFSSCAESTRPIEVISLQERLEVNVRTTTKVAYPKRGVLIHYSALGCELPTPTPPHMTLVRRSERRVKYVCDPLYVFPDTAESSRELVCTSKHTWNRPLPACVEKRSTEGSGLVSHYEQKRKISDSDDMSDKQADTVYDILIPSMVIAALFIVNGIVFAVIMRYRNKRKQRLELDSKELAEL